MLLPQVNLPSEGNSDIGTLFAEELGLVLEVSPDNEQQVVQAYQKAGLVAHSIGSVTSDASISIAVDDDPQIAGVALKPSPHTTYVPPPLPFPN